MLFCFVLTSLLCLFAGGAVAACAYAAFLLLTFIKQQMYAQLFDHHPVWVMYLAGWSCNLQHKDTQYNGKYIYHYFILIRKKQNSSLHFSDEEEGPFSVSNGKNATPWEGVL